MTYILKMLKEDNFFWRFFFPTTFIWIIYVLHFSASAPFWDAWDFNIPIFNGDSILSIFLYQHGPHRQGLGGVIHYFTLESSGYNFKIISWIALCLIYFTSFIYISILRLYNKNKINTIYTVILILSISFSSNEVITVNPNLSHGSLPFLLTAIIIYLHSIDPFKNWRNGLIPLLVFVATFTGFSFIFTFTFLLISALYFYVEKVNKFYYLILLLTFVACLSFFLNYSFNASAVSCNTSFDFKMLPNYFWFMVKVLTLPLFGGYLNKISPTIFLIVSITYFLMLAFVSVKTLFNFKRYPKISSVILSMIFYSTLFGFISSIGRICLGSGAEFAERYYLYMLPSLFAIIIYFMNHGIKVHYKIFDLFLKLLVYILVIINCFYLKYNFQNNSNYNNIKINWLKCVKSSNDINSCGKRFSIHPNIESIEGRAKIFLEKSKS